MKRLDLAQATDSLATYVQNLGQGNLVIIQDGQPVAVLMPITEDQLEDRSLSQNPEFLEILEQSRASFKERGGISLEEMKQRLGLA
jgi:antitoxin (DNA-binding transcriptional repressor) of toxin-antitoxin stability system